MDAGKKRSDRLMIKERNFVVVFSLTSKLAFTLMSAQIVRWGFHIKGDVCNGDVSLKALDFTLCSSFFIHKEK